MSRALFFDCEYHLDKINQINDFLRRLDELIDWSIFLDLLTQTRPSKKKSNAGRPAFDEELKRRGFDPQIIERAYRNHSLTDEQKANNKLKSKIRCHIEHIFGAQKMRMGNEIFENDWNDSGKISDWNAELSLQ